MPDVGRIADDDVERVWQADEQKVAMDQPGVGQRRGRLCIDAVLRHQRDECGVRAHHAVAMQFNGPHATGKGLDRRGDIIRTLPRLQQSLDSGQQEIAIAERRLEQAHAVQRLVGGVAAQVQHEVNDFTAREDGAALVRATRVGEQFDRVGDRAHARK